MEEAAKYQVADDQELSKMLHQLLIVNGEPEVEIRHPTEGVQIVKKEDYEKTIVELKRIRELSPAKRMQERNKNERRMQFKFRTAMIKAKVHTINVSDEDSFGKDINGEELDMEGMIFMPVKNYLDGIVINENEIGCFMRENLDKPPIRLLSMESLEPESN